MLLHTLQANMKWWKQIGKLSSIWMKILNDIPCNLTWIQFKFNSIKNLIDFNLNSNGFRFNKFEFLNS